MMHKQHVVIAAVQLTWWIRVMRLIRCTIDPQINHEARINHVNPTKIVLVSEFLMQKRLMGLGASWPGAS